MNITNPPLVSVMVITFNQVDFIRDTLSSVVEQNYENFEYIVADDGSTDGTVEVIKEFASNYPCINAIYGENVGITRNSNRGLRECRGEFVALQGGDDVFYPGKLKKQVEWFQEDRNRVLCGHRLALINERGTVFGEYSIKRMQGKGNRRWVECGPLYGATSIMIRRAEIPTLGFDERLPIVSDWKLYIDALKEGGEYGYVDEVLGAYRKHANNVTNVKEPAMIDAKKTLDIVRSETNVSRLSIRKGVAYIILYGRALELYHLGNCREALKMFYKSAKYWPFSIKVYVRICQVLAKSLSRMCVAKSPY